MPQRGDNPNEVLFEDNTPFGYRVTNYSDYEHTTCRSPEDILAELEELFYSPLAFVEYRESQISKWHSHWRKEQGHTVVPHATREQLHACAIEAAPKPHQHYLKQQPKTDKPTLTKEQLIAFDTEHDRLLEFFIHERITNG